jgi:glyoxylase-like metal-dependent hydrolase (beta-lactamase superfamily II)
MIFQQYFLACLSQASYLVGDETTGHAVVVDPQRDVSGYLQDAERLGLEIEHVIETHVHADFISGHLELAAATGARICFGEAAETEFAIHRLQDGDRIVLGQVCLEIRATPGHTPESISIVVYEHATDDIPYAVLTGDTLFIGDVGRPDLLSAQGTSSRELASRLFRSLHEQLLTLPDATRVYPAHGAGSSCGKNLSSETWSTMGEQRRSNYALMIKSEAEFVASVIEDQPIAPAYFAYDARLNRERRDLLDDHLAPQALRLEEVLQRQSTGAVVLDTRDPADFAAGHLEGSLNVGLGGRFAESAGEVLDPTDSVVIVCDPGHATEARVRLARIGYDRVVGHLEGDVASALRELPSRAERSSRLTAVELRAKLTADAESEVVVIDVRNPSELDSGRIEGSLSIPLPQLVSRMDEIPSDRAVVLYCASGYRSSVAASLIARGGHFEVSDLIGGFAAWATVVTDSLEQALPG